MKQKNDSVRNVGWGSAGFILLAFMLLSAFGLNILFCGKTAEEIHVNAQRFSAAGAVRRIEYAINMGKPAERFYGASDILGQIIRESRGYIVGAGILDTSAGDNLLYKMPGDADFAGFKAQEQALYQKARGLYYTEIPVSDNVAVCLLIGGSTVESATLSYIKEAAIICLIIMAAAGIALFTLTRLGRLNKTAVIVVLLVAQLLLGVYLVFNYNGIYHSFLDGTASTLEYVIGADIQYLAQYGILPDEYFEFDTYLSDICARLPEILTLSPIAPQAGESYLVINLPYDKSLYAVLDEAIINRKIADIVIETIVMAVISVLITLEILYLVAAKKRPQHELEDSGQNPALRMLYFIPYMGVSMAAAFVTIIAYKMFASLEQGSPLIAGVPATAEMLSGVAAIVLSGFITKKLGYTKTITVCLLACAAGTVLSGVSGNIYHFAASRAVTGFGFSLFIMTGRLLAASQKKEESRADMLSMLTSGTMTGYCCGAVVGGLLSDRFSYSTVLYISSAVILAAAPFLNMSRLNKYESGNPATLKNMLALLRSPDTAGYLLLLIMPAYAGGMFVAYSLPIFGVQNGLSQTMIAGLMMLNSLLAAYLMPFMTKNMMRVFGASFSACLYGVTIAAALGLFRVFTNIGTLIVAVVILGVADSFGYVIIIEGFYAQKSTAGKSSSDLMTGLTLIGKAGQAIAPSLLSADGGMSGLLAGTVAIGTLLHTILSRKKSKKDSHIL